MCPAYYFLLLVNFAQSPNGQSFPISKICLKVKLSKSAQRVPKVSECPSQAWGLPFKGRSMFTLTSMVMLSIIIEVMHMYISIAIKLF